MPTELVITEEETLRDPDITWLAWGLTLLAGFVTGATANLLALWLFAHYVHK